MMKRFAILIFLMPFLVRAETSTTDEFTRFAATLKSKFRQFGWNDIKIDSTTWEFYRKSNLNNPLFFKVFGNNANNTTIFLGGVHGDEPAPIYILTKLALFLQDHPDYYKDKQIVIAPLVNPDGFLASRSMRTNGRGVDLNRNFPTRNWAKDAFVQWKRHEHGAKRKFPGPFAGSESETRFQIALLNRFSPQKIISIHSPLGFYDYDGATSDLDRLGRWLTEISKETDFPVNKFRVYPGSLGNYVGVERRIFTITLELSSSNPAKANDYFDLFRQSFIRLTELMCTADISR
jgi:protein MpaA